MACIAAFFLPLTPVIFSICSSSLAPYLFLGFFSLLFISLNLQLHPVLWGYEGEVSEQVHTQHRKERERDIWRILSWNGRSTVQTLIHFFLSFFLSQVSTLAHTSSSIKWVTLTLSLSLFLWSVYNYLSFFIFTFTSSGFHFPPLLKSASSSSSFLLHPSPKFKCWTPRNEQSMIMLLFLAAVFASSSQSYCRRLRSCGCLFDGFVSYVFFWGFANYVMD